MTVYDVAIIGSGPAGMAAAWSSAKSGAQKVIIIDRNERPGGILSQCVHSGFGLSLYNRDYTGPEYSMVWQNKLADLNIKSVFSTTVLDIHKESELFCLELLGKEAGMSTIKTKTVIMACGCRERTLGEMRIPGSRPSGIFMAGSAQYMVNISNLKPGKSVVIMGLGDIGLIMARRLAVEGINVRLLFGERANALVRNYVHCVRAFDIPVKDNYTLLSTHGYKRLKGVTIARIGDDGNPDYSTKEYIPCDTLLVAAGLIQETRLWNRISQGEAPSETRGIKANQMGVTSVPGIFACGNVCEISDMADKVTSAGILSGISAAGYLGCELPEEMKEINENSLKVYFDTPLKMHGQIPADTTHICTVCPVGCVINTSRDLAKLTEDNFKSYGFKCKRGFEKGFEILKDKMVLTTTLKVRDSDQLLPVKSDRLLSQAEIMEAMPQIHKLILDEPAEFEKPVAEIHCGNFSFNLISCSEI